MGKKIAGINVVFTDAQLDEIMKEQQREIELVKSGEKEWVLPGEKQSALEDTWILALDFKTKMRFRFNFDNHNIIVERCPVDVKWKIGSTTTGYVRPGESKIFSGVRVTNQCSLP